MFVVSKQKWTLFIWHPRDSKEVKIIHNFSKCHPGSLFKNGQRYCKTFSQVIFKIVGPKIWAVIYLKQCLSFTQLSYTKRKHEYLIEPLDCVSRNFKVFESTHIIYSWQMFFHIIACFFGMDGILSWHWAIFFSGMK